jgi:hypothetical protein
MIIFNNDRFFSGGRCGVIRNASFRCALNTVSDSHGSFVVVSSFSGEWDFKNYEPIAEALLDKKFSRKQTRQMHDAFLEQMDRCGANGIDLGGAIDEVFGDAHQKGIVTRYENNAPLRLGGQP